MEFIPFNKACLVGDELEYISQAIRNGHIAGDGPFTHRCERLLQEILGVEKILQASIPGAAGQPHQIIKDAGHFIQEDAGEELADCLIKWLL